MKKLIFILLISMIAFGQSLITPTELPYYISTLDFSKSDIDTMYGDNLKLYYVDEDTMKFVCNVHFTGDVTFDGNFDVTGFINSNPTFTYAYLFENDTTEIVKADSAHVLQGNFINSPQFGFKIANGRLVYTGTKAQWFDIDLSATYASNEASTITHFLFLNDDSLYTPQKNGAETKFANDIETVTTFLTLYLEPFDSVSIMVEANKLCEIDSKHVNTRITRTNF